MINIFYFARVSSLYPVVILRGSLLDIDINSAKIPIAGQETSSEKSGISQGKSDITIGDISQRETTVTG